MHTSGFPTIAMGSSSQKNFDFFMQGLQHVKPEFVPDVTYFKHLIAKLILYRAVQRIVRQQKFPAYQANIVAYLVAMLSWQSVGRLDLDRIWREQALSPAGGSHTSMVARN